MSLLILKDDSTINLFNNIIVEVDIDSSVLLSNGSSKKASDITINDDIDDDWIKLNIDKKI